VTTRVLLVDDQDLVRAGFRLILGGRDEITVVGEAGDGEEAVRLARELAPDVIVMDIRMPGMDGITATRRILEARPAARILILTTFDTDEHVFAAIRAGASAFLLKDTRADQFVEAIRTVAGGHAVIAPATTSRLLDHLARTAPATAADDRLEALTVREREVLVHIARGLTNQEIAEAMYLGESTVKTHVSAIMRKLDLRDRVHAVIAAYDHGLVRPNA
jgi:DNA-binding NarL/FixJ family response regulator